MDGKFGELGKRLHLNKQYHIAGKFGGWNVWRIGQLEVLAKESLVNWAPISFGEGNLANIGDSRLQRKSIATDVHVCFQLVGSKCS